MNRGTRRMRRHVGVLAAALIGWMLGGAGCGRPPARLNAPPQGHSEQPHALQEPFVHMTDNALLEEMSVSPAHFVPHAAELNALGVRRLKRYATLLKVYGGTLRYDGTDEPESLVTQRLERVKGLLIAEGVEPTRFDLAAGLAGGSTMNAKEAITIRQAGNFKECQADQKQGTPADLATVLGGKSQ